MSSGSKLASPVGGENVYRTVDVIDDLLEKKFTTSGR